MKYFSLPKSKWTTSMLLATTVLSGEVIAALSNTSTLVLKRSTKEEVVDSKFSGSVAFQTNQWMENVGDVVGNKYFGEFDVNYESSSIGSADKKFELRSRVNDEEQLMFSIPESYLKFEFGNHEAYLGRKVLDWSEADKNWGFGKLNNRINFDGFEPGQEGLTGALIELKPSKFFKFSFFGSFVYAPELNPGTKIDEENGTITCQNAWCKAPDAAADTNQDGVANTPIFYDVDVPEISEIVFRYSAGMSLLFGAEDVSGRVFAMRKPENNISLSVEVSLDAAENVITADVTPQVYYHNVYGGEIKIGAIKNTEIYGTYLRVDPDSSPDGDETTFVYTGIRPNKKVEEYLGAGARYANNSYSITANYIARVSEFDISEDILVEYPRWNQAVNLGINTRLTKKLGLSFDYKYDMLTEDRLTMLKANYLIRRNMMISAGANIIGSSGKNDSYWSDFVNNDSVYSSFKYMF